MKLTHFDRTLIHGLGLLSRPPITPNPSAHKMVADIVTIAAERATDEGELSRLIKMAARIGHNEQAHRGVFHEVAAAMNEFDRVARGAHWDAARGVK